MAILKSINDNYKNWKSSDFLQRSTLDEKQKRLATVEELGEWIEIGPELRITRLPQDCDKDAVFQLWLKTQERFETERNNKHKPNYILIVNDEWNDKQLEMYQQLIETKNYKFWLGLYDQNVGQIINPLKSLKTNLWQRIRQGKKRRALREIIRMTSYEPLLQYLLNDEIVDKTEKDMLSQAGTNGEKLQNWMGRLQQAKMWDDDEKILDMTHIKLYRNHYSVNSNFNKSGKLIITNKKLVFAKRSFSLFGFGLATLIPLIAFVRPANKMIALGRIAVQYLKVPFQALKPVLSAGLPAIAVAIVSFNFISFSTIANFFNNLPILSFVVPTVDFVVKNPWTIASFGGFYPLFRWGLLKLFFRKEKLIILPHDQLQFILASNRDIIGRWKVKGNKTVRAKEGIEYRIKIRSYDQNISNQQLAQQMQLQLLTNSSIS